MSTSLKLFIRASDALIRFGTHFDTIPENFHTVYNLENQSEELRKLWDKLQNTYEKCLDFFETSDTVEKNDIEATSAKYNEAYMTYLKYIGLMREKLHKLGIALKLSGSTIGKEVNENLPLNVTLPPCDVDIFKGDYLSWDLFSALYINNSRLTDVDRLYRLLRKTEGDAKEIVSKSPLSNEGFELAWKSLRDNYENPRILVNNQLKILFGLPFLDEETSTGLKTLQRGINNCLSSIAIYNVLTDNWDPLIVFICIQRLPSFTVSLWEHSVTNKQDLNNFLTERIQILNCLQDLKGSDMGKSNCHVVSSDYTSTSISCILCPKRHYLRNCQQFRSLSISDRISAVQENNCCTNCLSRSHNNSSCRSSNNCLICDDRHHTMLHHGNTENKISSEQSSSAVTRPNNSNNNFSTSTGTSQNYQTFHTHQNQSVLLGTAIVNVIHNGNRYQVRALIDSGSESSFISEGLQRRLNLSTHSTLCNVSSIGSRVSIRSRKICTLKISSVFDSNVTLNTNAIFLPQISGNLPSFSYDRNIKERLPNLRLADPNPFDNRPVEVLIGADLYPALMLPQIRKNILGSLLGQNTGWILTGPVNTPTYRSNFISVNHNRTLISN